MKNPKSYMPEERFLFTICGSWKRKIVTTVIFISFVIASLAAMFVAKDLWLLIGGIGGMLITFWPMSDAYEHIEITNMRIIRSKFSKITAKTSDISLNDLAECRMSEDGKRIEMIFLLGRQQGDSTLQDDDSYVTYKIGNFFFNKTDKNALRVLELPCPKKNEWEQVVASYRRR